jgi:DNA-binding response OmpR family regulator
MVDSKKGLALRVLWEGTHHKRALPPMAIKHPILFVLEDCPTTALIIERTVMLEMPEVRVLWARNVDEAMARAEGLDVDVFLVDICLPDGNGFDFLWAMAMDHPSARAVVMTAKPLPEHAAHSTALGILHFLEKPVQAPTLIEKLRPALNQPAEEGSEDFRAVLKNVTPADIIQLKCLSGATTVLEFLSSVQVGRIRFEHGEIVDARVGELKGTGAVYEILSWQRGQVTEHPCVGFVDRTVERPWQSLLMDAAHRVDERRAVALV